MINGGDRDVGLGASVEVGGDVDERFVIEELRGILLCELGVTSDLDYASWMRRHLRTVRRRSAPSGAESPKCSFTASSM